MPTSFLVTVKLSPSLPTVFPGGQFDNTFPVFTDHAYWFRSSGLWVVRNARMENHNGMLRLPRTCNVIWPAELVTNECHFRQRSLYPPTQPCFSIHSLEENDFTDMPTHGLSFMPKITIKDANKVTEVLFCLWKRDKNT
jgi:hypothetical protein